jgi:hypothetical protein
MMKTFKLKGLKVMKKEVDQIEEKTIDLVDGLVINREDEDGWLIEAYANQEYRAYLEQLQDVDEVMIQVKITREENDPAFLLRK